MIDAAAAAGSMPSQAAAGASVRSVWAERYATAPEGTTDGAARTLPYDRFNENASTSRWDPLAES